MIATFWNDTNFNPKLTLYPNLHPELSVDVDISFEAVKNMGELTANKAKAFYMRMRKELIIIKGNYEASGNGFGSAPSEGSSNEFVGDDRKDFLSVYSPAILYLWQKSEEHAFVGNITQQLSTEVGIDTGIKRSK